MAEPVVGVIGAGSLVGGHLLSQLGAAGWKALSWKKGVTRPEGAAAPVADWISLAPIWTLADYFGLFEAVGARRVVALSSTSVWSKADSDDPEEQVLVARLRLGEAQLQAWGGHQGVDWVLLRPTLIYGGGEDRNVSEIARLITRFGWFPLWGGGHGLRQPVHAADVAGACVAALTAPVAGQTYALSGGETLPYRHMVLRVFEALGRPPRLLPVPLWLFRLVLVPLHLVPRYRHWRLAMARRMGQDLVFDHQPAVRDLGFAPRPFRLTREDLP